MVLMVESKAREWAIVKAVAQVFGMDWSAHQTVLDMLLKKPAR
jgi:hypothetical protein